MKNEWSDGWQGYVFMGCIIALGLLAWAGLSL